MITSSISQKSPNVLRYEAVQNIHENAMKLRDLYEEHEELGNLPDSVMNHLFPTHLENWCGDLGAARRKLLAAMDDQEFADATEEQVADKIIELLKDGGFEASWEFPGYICVPVGELVLNIGTVNGYWGFDVTDANGINYGIEGAEWPYEKLWPRQVETNPSMIIRYILSVIEKVRAIKV